MNWKKSTWKIATFLVVGFLIFNPELVVFGMFIDAVGLDLFLLLLEVQVVALFGYYFQNWIKPAINLIKGFIQKHDPYFFIPTRNVISKFPAILCHALPGYFAIYLSFVVDVPESVFGKVYG